MASIRNNGTLPLVVGTVGDDYFDNSTTGPQTLLGGLGNDIYEVDNASDMVIEYNAKVEGIDTIVISSPSISTNFNMSTNANNVENMTLIGNLGSGSVFTGNSLDNLIDATAASSAVNLQGGLGNDTLNGGTTSDTLDGGVGADVMSGGNGSDVYYVDNTADKVIELASYNNSFNDTVNAVVTYTLAADVENLNLQGSSNINGIGNALNNTIQGNAGNNIISGADGIDFLVGNGGNDNIDGGNGNDYVTGSIGNDTLSGGAGNDSIVGGDGKDSMSGGEGNDTLRGGSNGPLGAKMDGGNGNDWLISTGATIGDTLLGGGGNDFIQLSGGQKEFVDAGDGDDIVVVFGSSGSDLGFGNTTLNGGAGNDTYYVQAVKSAVNMTITDTAGIDTIRLADSGGIVSTLQDSTWSAGFGSILGGGTLRAYTLGAGIENLLADLSSVSSKYLVGNNLNNLITGTNSSDALFGKEGNDTLDGGGSIDNMVGGIGDDTYVVNNFNDSIYEALNAGKDTVWAYSDYALASNIENLTLFGTVGYTGLGNDLANVIIGNVGNNTLDGGAGNDSIFGDAGSDVIYAGSGNDTIDGGTGNDTLYGGLGNDTYFVDSANDSAIDIKDGGTDIVFSTATSHTLSKHIENLTLLATAETGVGNDLKNVITGNDSNNRLQDGGVYDAISETWSGGEKDTLIGGKGDDEYLVVWDNTGQDIITDTAGTHDSLYVYMTTQYLTTFGVNISLTGALASIETIIVNSGTYAQSANFNGFNITGNTANNGIYGSNLNDTLNGGDGNDYLVGNDGLDSISGGAGNDTLIGDNDGFADTLVGGAGDDTYNYDSVDTYVELTAGGIDTINVTDNSLTLSSIASGNIENITYASYGGGSYTLNGTAADNTISVLESSAALVIEGGAGNDTYILGQNGAINNLTINDSAGNDQIISYLSSIDMSVVATTVERITLMNTSASSVTGNDLNNIIIGNVSNDFINGGLGADTMTGGAGDDLYLVDNVADKIIELANGGNDSVSYVSAGTYTLGDNVENGQASNNTKIIGNALNNTLNSNGSLNVTLDGGAGNDILLGLGSNASTLIGGTGDDTFYIENTFDVVTELDVGGNDTVIAATGTTTYTLTNFVETLTYQTGAANATMTGNALNNVIQYTGTFFGADTIDGGLGADTMDGGNGGDVYLVDNIGDMILDSGASGTDEIRASGISSFDMMTNGWNVESFSLTGNLNTVANIIGNSLANTINLANYTVAGAYIDGGGSADSITGTNQADTLIGGSDNDALIGGGGADRLIGNQGIDVLTGGTGADVFVFNSTLELISSDTITDFVSGTDSIELDTTIFTNLASLNTISTDELRIGAGVTEGQDGNDYLIYNTNDGSLYYDADGSLGGIGSIKIATLTGHPTLAASDFDLV